jgi:serine/threonine-protein kinase
LLEPGAIVDSYRILSVLGEGGMGVVYLAEHVALGRRVALKLLRPHLNEHQGVVSRFIDEARVVNQIGHENIIEVTDFGTGPEGECFFVMELLAGESLTARMSREPLPVPMALHVAFQIADALAASHAVDVVHRDLKPDNIFLIHRRDDDAYVKVLDFGIAKLHTKVRSPKDPRRTGTGEVIGTPVYMSPEQAMGREDLDHRSDIYSLGIILYEMLTGQVPFSGPSWMEVLTRKVRETVPRLADTRPDLPPVLDQVVARAVAREPADRWSSMAELRDVLAPLQRRSAGFTGTGTGPAATAAGPAATGVGRALASTDPELPARSSRGGLWAALALVLVLAAAGGIWRAVIPGSAPAAPPSAIAPAALPPPPAVAVPPAAVAPAAPTALPVTPPPARPAAPVAPAMAAPASAAPAAEAAATPPAAPAALPAETPHGVPTPSATVVAHPPATSAGPARALPARAGKRAPVARTQRPPRSTEPAAPSSPTPSPGRVPIEFDER